MPHINIAEVRVRNEFEALGLALSLDRHQPGAFTGSFEGDSIDSMFSQGFRAAAIRSPARLTRSKRFCGRPSRMRAGPTKAATIVQPRPASWLRRARAGARREVMPTGPSPSSCG